MHLYLGLAHAGLAQAEQAIEAFKAALLLDPSVRLPEGTSPRIRGWWRKAGVASGARANALSQRAHAEQSVGTHLALQSEAEGMARLANVLFATAGAALVGGGVVLVLTFD